MNPISAIKLIPKFGRTMQAIDVFMAAAPADRDDAGEQLAAEALPFIEGFVGRDLVDDAAVIHATGEILQAFESFLVVVRDAKAKAAATAGQESA
jgi:hypothetical protein